MEVIVERIDGGGAKDKGSFRCTLCNASIEQAHFKWPEDHVRRRHKGCSSRLCRLIPCPKTKRKSEEEIRESRRQKNLRFRQKQKEQDEAALDVSGVAFPIAISATNAYIVKSYASRGSGKRLLLSGGDQQLDESLDVAISFAAANAASLRSWVTGHPKGLSSAGLFTSCQDLSLAFENLDVEKEGTSASACAALSLACLLGKCRMVKDKVAVTGRLDLRGRITEVDGIREKLALAMSRGVDMLVIPESSYRALERSLEMEQWPENLRNYRDQHMKTVRTFIDLLCLTIPEFRARLRPEILQGLDGPPVGVGVVVGLTRDGVGRVEFQACSVGPGKRDLILTGTMGRCAKQGVQLMTKYIVEATEQIRTCMGIPADKKLCLQRPSHNLHVHSDYWEEVKGGYQYGAIFIALVSLMIKRRCRADTAIFGEVNHSGAFTSKWELTAEDFCVYVRAGIRRLVLGKGTRISEEAKERAASRQGDGMPFVDWCIKSTIVEALPFMYASDEEVDERLGR